AVVDADQRGVGLGIPAVYDPVADGDARRPRNAEPHHLLARDGVRLDVDGIELDPPRRQQLLRLGAGGSAGPGVQACFHHGHYTRPAMPSQRPLYTASPGRSIWWCPTPAYDACKTTSSALGLATPCGPPSRARSCPAVQSILVNRCAR